MRDRQLCRLKLSVVRPMWQNCKYSYHCNVSTCRLSGKTTCWYCK